MKTTIINIKHKVPYDVYIGRLNRFHPDKYPQSPYANPFKVGKDGTQEEVVEKFREWFLSQPDLVEKARKELKGKVLGCWDKPKACHGDVLVEVVEMSKNDLDKLLAQHKKRNLDKGNSNAPPSDSL